MKWSLLWRVWLGFLVGLNTGAVISFYLQLAGGEASLVDGLFMPVNLGAGVFFAWCLWDERREKCRHVHRRQIIIEGNPYWVDETDEL